MDEIRKLNEAQYHDRVLLFAKHLIDSKGYTALARILESYDGLIRDQYGISENPDYPFLDLCCGGNNAIK